MNFKMQHVHTYACVHAHACTQMHMHTQASFTTKKNKITLSVGTMMVLDIITLNKISPTERQASHVFDSVLNVKIKRCESRHRKKGREWSRILLDIVTIVYAQQCHN